MNRPEKMRHEASPLALLGFVKSERQLGCIRHRIESEEIFRFAPDNPRVRTSQQLTGNNRLFCI